MKKCKFCDPQNKVQQVMHEFKEGKLESGKSHKLVTSRKQAVAIALSQGRKKCGCTK